MIFKFAAISLRSRRNWVMVGRVTNENRSERLLIETGGWICSRTVTSIGHSQVDWVPIV